MFEIQKSGDRTSSGEIGLDIRTHASPKVGQDQVSGGVSVLCWHAAPVAYVLSKDFYLTGMGTLYCNAVSLFFYIPKIINYIPELQLHVREQDKSSDIEQQPTFGDCKYNNSLPQKKGGGIQNQREHSYSIT